MPYLNPEIIIDNDLNNAESSKNLVIKVTAEMWADLMHHTHQEFEAMSGVVNDLAVDSAIEKIGIGGDQDIKLMADTDFTKKSHITVKAGDTLSLDIAGREAIFDNGISGIEVSGELIIDDSTGSGTIITTSPYDSTHKDGIFRCAAGGRIVVDGGDIEVAFDDPVNEGQFAITATKANSSIEINGGKIRAGWYAIATNGNSNVTGTSMVVNDGELISIADYAIYAPATDGVVEINGGVIRGAAGAICANGGNITINGGQLSSLGNGDTGTWSDGTGGEGNSVIDLPAKYAAVTCTINGGIFTAPEGTPVIVKGNNATVVIKGGTFTSDVSEYVAEGFICIINSAGLYEVVEALQDDDTVIDDGDGDPDGPEAPVEDDDEP